mgnify:CR=1 FL=1
MTWIRKLLPLVVVCVPLIFGVGIGRKQPAVRVDLVELNHFCPGEAYQFSQLIWYEYSAEYRRFHVVCWRLIEDSSERPVKTPRGWLASLCGREVLATHYRETWTEKDPEMENQKLFAGTYRPGFDKRGRGNGLR